MVEVDYYWCVQKASSKATYVLSGRTNWYEQGPNNILVHHLGHSELPVPYFKFTISYLFLILLRFF